MEEKKTIYVVTAGEYSDYRIEAIFDSIELANKYIARFPKLEYNDIEEYKLNDYAKYINGDYGDKVAYQIYIDKNGDIPHIFELPPSEYPRCENNSVEFFKLRPNENMENAEIRACFHLLAKDKEHAIKIAGERRTQLLANNEWKVTK